MEKPLRVASVRQRLALGTPTRFGLGFVLLGGSLASDVSARSAVLAFAVGAFVVAFAALVDRRGLLLHEEPRPLPSGAVHDPGWRIALDAALPSTLGVSALAVIALVASQPILGAILAGAVAGLGVASAIGFVPVLAWERERRTRLYLGSDGRQFFG
jgi:hypothetical protein